MNESSLIQEIPSPKRKYIDTKHKYTPLIDSNLKFLKQLRELTIFEHQMYGRIVSASFDNVLIIVLTKQVIASI